MARRSNGPLPKLPEQHEFLPVSRLLLTHQEDSNRASPSPSQVGHINLQSTTQESPPVKVPSPQWMAKIQKQEQQKHRPRKIVILALAPFRARLPVLPPGATRAWRINMPEAIPINFIKIVFC